MSSLKISNQIEISLNLSRKSTQELNCFISTLLFNLLTFFLSPRFNFSVFKQFSIHSLNNSTMRNFLVEKNFNLHSAIFVEQFNAMLIANCYTFKFFSLFIRIGKGRRKMHWNILIKFHSSKMLMKVLDSLETFLCLCNSNLQFTRFCFIHFQLSDINLHEKYFVLSLSLIKSTF